MKTMELRSSKVDLTSNGEMIVSGYVNRPGALSEVLGVVNKFREKIAKGAFAEAIENGQRDIDFLAEHDSKSILASTRNGSLELREDEQGLFMSATITPTSWGQDYYTLISSGLIKNMSFGFRAIKDSWSRENGMNIRTVEELELYEISAVKDPAYSQSTIAARGIDLIEEVEVPNMEQTANKKTEHSKINERGNSDMEKMIEKRSTDFEKFLRGQVEMRALQQTADGSAVIPDNVENMIVKKMEETSPVFQRARKLNSTSGSLKVARETALSAAGFVGEGEDVAEEALSLDDVKLQQKRVGSAISLSNQLINDSAVDIEAYASNLLARRAAKAVEKSILVGAGGNEFTGIVGDADIAEVDSSLAAGAVTIDTLQALYLAVHPEFLQNAAFIVSRSFFNQIAKLKDGMNHYYIQNGVVNGRLTYTLFGAEVLVTDSLGDGTVAGDVPMLFGNIEEAYSIMVKKGFGLKKISLDTTQALRGSQLLVLDGYMDGAVVNPQAMAMLAITA